MGTRHAGALAAAYRKYAWTHLRWVPRPARAALHLNLFEQPERKRVFQYSVRMLQSRKNNRSALGLALRSISTG